MRPFASSSLLTHPVCYLAVTDDVAGFARIEAAAASKARKEKEAAELAADNAAMRDTLNNTAARTDNTL